MNDPRAIDGVLVQWGDRLFYDGNRRVPAGQGGPRSGGALRERAAAIRQRIEATAVRRAPQVMVKVTGGGRGMAAIAAHLRYLDQYTASRRPVDGSPPIDFCLLTVPSRLRLNLVQIGHHARIGRFTIVLQSNGRLCGSNPPRLRERAVVPATGRQFLESQQDEAVALQACHPHVIKYWQRKRRRASLEQHRDDHQLFAVT